MTPSVAILSVTQGIGSGAEQVLAHLLMGLGKRFAGGTLVISPERSLVMDAARAAGCGTLPWRASRDRMPENFVALLRARRELPASITRMHAWTARAFEWAACLCPRCASRPTGTLHDHPRAPFHSFGRRLLMRSVADRLRAIVCVSEALKSACERERWKAPLVVVHNGLPPYPRQALRQGGGPTRIGFLGLHVDWKGFTTVLRWAKEMGADPVEWHLFGEPTENAGSTLRALPAMLGQRVISHGRVAPEDIYHAVDLVVHPSLFFDPLPTVLIESARAGIPAVASDVGGTAEIVADGETGFLFPPEEPGRGRVHIRALASDPALRLRMGEAARRRFESRFAVGRMVDSYIALWEERLQKCAEDS